MARRVCMSDETPYLEFRIGGLRLTVQRRPVRLLTALAVVMVLMGGGWAWGGSGFPMP